MKRRRTAGRRKPILERKRKNNSNWRTAGTSSGAPSKCPSPPLSSPNRGQPRAEKERRREAGAGCGSSGASAPTARETGSQRRERRRGRAEPPWRCSPPATAVERRDDGAVRSPDATVGDGSRRGAGDDVCGAATGPTAVPPTARQLSAPRASSCCSAPAPKAAVVAAQGERGGARPDAREGGDVDGGSSLRRSNRPWEGRSPAAT